MFSYNRVCSLTIECVLLRIRYGYGSSFAVASPVLACGMLLPLLAVYLEHDASLGLGMGAVALILFVALLVIRGTGVALQTTSNALCNQVTAVREHIP